MKNIVISLIKTGYSILMMTVITMFTQMVTEDIETVLLVSFTITMFIRHWMEEKEKEVDEETERINKQSQEIELELARLDGWNECYNIINK